MSSTMHVKSTDTLWITCTCNVRFYNLFKLFYAEIKGNLYLKKRISSRGGESDVCLNGHFTLQIGK